MQKYKCMQIIQFVFQYFMNGPGLKLCFYRINALFITKIRLLNFIISVQNLHTPAFFCDPPFTIPSLSVSVTRYGVVRGFCDEGFKGLSVVCCVIVIGCSDVVIFV